MFNKYVLIIFTVLLSGCATTAGYEAVLRSWTGQNINALISSWGYPESSFTAPDGNTVYVYSRGGSMTMPTQTTFSGQVSPWGSYSGNSFTTGGQTLNFWCKTFFEVDNNKTIINWRWEGNNCVAMAPEEPKDSFDQPSQKESVSNKKSVSIPKEGYFYRSNNDSLMKTAKIYYSRLFASHPRFMDSYKFEKNGQCAEDCLKVKGEIKLDIQKAVETYASKNQIRDVFSVEQCKGGCDDSEDISDKIIKILNKENQASSESYQQKKTVNAKQNQTENAPQVKQFNNVPFVVSGIINGEEPFAVIDGKFFKKGEMIGNYQINQIGSDYVEFIDKDGQLLQKKIGK